MSYFHCVKRGILGVRTVHGFGSDWGDLEEDRLIGGSPQRDSARETLGEPPTFKLWHQGLHEFHFLHYYSLADIVIFQLLIIWKFYFAL